MRLYAFVGGAKEIMALEHQQWLGLFSFSPHPISRYNTNISTNNDTNSTNDNTNNNVNINTNIAIFDYQYYLINALCTSGCNYSNSQSESFVLVALKAAMERKKKGTI